MTWYVPNTRSLVLNVYYEYECEQVVDLTEFFSHLRLEIIKVFSDPLYKDAVKVKLNKIYKISSNSVMNQGLYYLLVIEEACYAIRYYCFKGAVYWTCLQITSRLYKSYFFLWYTQNLAEENVALKININKEKIVTVSAA